MEAKAVVIEVRKCEKHGKVGKVVAEVDSMFLARVTAGSLNNIKQSGIIGYAFARIDMAQRCAESGGFMLVK